MISVAALVQEVNIFPMLFEKVTIAVYVLVPDRMVKSL